MVHYEPFPKYPLKRRIGLSPYLFKNHPDVLIHNDLIDCRLDICSIEVPALFTENFDYQNMRTDFIRGILGSEILGKTIFCHILVDSYATSVTTQSMFHTVSMDVMNRWAYPLVPENLTYGEYQHARHNIYKGQDITLTRYKVVIQGYSHITSSDNRIKD